MNQIGELVNVFKKYIKLFKKHIFNIQYRTCLKNLGEDEAALHLDFSENFKSKLDEELELPF